MTIVALESTETGQTAAPRKFSNPDVTITGEPRAQVPFQGYETVWFNTGTLCNIACQNCYIDSSPKNDQLVYLTRAEVGRFLDEARQIPKKPSLIGFTGGEPFMNPDIIGMLEDCLFQGFSVLVLTNAMRPMQRHREALQELQTRFPGRLSLRVSLDHYEQEGHEEIRGARTWQPALEGLAWLAKHSFDVSIAGRLLWTIDEDEMRRGYQQLFSQVGLDINAADSRRLILFPEMLDDDNTPEVSEGCWKKLNLSPRDVMCASSRMVIKRKGAESPTVVACTLLPYAKDFELGGTLEDARSTVSLNHRHCSRFCVLGKASCRVD
ncbi:radical SAM protein [Hyphomicrobium sp. 99]|uniref:radical SAM protein n=1 Tax=Hyphomicrobium sp. 99 TaxID=1163419 RepID=UPI0005F7B0D4|nr:radical SAM protein [Hyphomicrobium sp. 99]